MPRFSSCPGAKIRHHRPAGTAKAQPCYFVLVVSAIMRQFLLATGASYLFFVFTVSVETDKSKTQPCSSVEKIFFLMQEGMNMKRNFGNIEILLKKN